MNISNIGSTQVGFNQGTHIWPLALGGKNYSILCALNGISAESAAAEVDSTGGGTDGEQVFSVGVAAVSQMGSASLVISEYQDSKGVHQNYNLAQAQLTGGTHVTFTLSASQGVSANAAFIIFEV